MQEAQLDIIFEDNHLIAINKPPGLLVQGDKTGDLPASEIVKNFLRKKYKKPGNVFCGVIHRLDRPVSGVLVLAKTGKALERMNQKFKSREIKKTYWAIISEQPPEMEATLEHFLIKNQAKNKSKAFRSPVKNGLKAVLKYKMIGSLTNYHFLEVNPLTGRHHQIRAQLAAEGCPIKGDLKYGFKRSNSDGSIHLHARELSFIHPVKMQPIIIKASPPQDVLWLSVLEHFV